MEGKDAAAAAEAAATVAAIASDMDWLTEEGTTVDGGLHWVHPGVMQGRLRRALGHFPLNGSADLKANETINTHANLNLNYL